MKCLGFWEEPSGASYDASRTGAGNSDEDNLPFVEQGHNQNVWSRRGCWLVEEPSQQCLAAGDYNILC